MDVARHLVSDANSQSNMDTRTFGIRTDCGKFRRNMDEIELTKLFVEYADLKKRLEVLRSETEAAVNLVGETRKIAGVTATYYKSGFEMPDYEKAAKENMPVDFDWLPYTYTTITSTTRWKDVCEVLKIIVPMGAEKPARVIVK